MTAAPTQQPQAAGVDHLIKMAFFLLLAVMRWRLALARTCVRLRSASNPFKCKLIATTLLSNFSVIFVKSSQTIFVIHAMLQSREVLEEMSLRHVSDD